MGLTNIWHQSSFKRDHMTLLKLKYTHWVCSCFIWYSRLSHLKPMLEMTLKLRILISYLTSSSQKEIFIKCNLHNHYWCFFHRWWHITLTRESQLKTYLKHNGSKSIIKIWQVQLKLSNSSNWICWRSWITLPISPRFGSIWVINITTSHVSNDSCNKYL